MHNVREIPKPVPGAKLGPRMAVNVPIEYGPRFEAFAKFEVFDRLLCMEHEP